MPRELWKGAIRFGLVHVPVSLYPAEDRRELSFTMLDKNDMQPVGYKRYNKSTGDDVAYEDIVKGYESPYYLAPGKHGDKGYALLREVLEKQGKVAVATVVIRTRQHIAVLYPRDNVLVLNTLRYNNELKSPKGLEVPADLKDAKVSPAELKMAERLIDDMAIRWDPKEYHDSYRDDLLRLIEQKASGDLRKMPKVHAQKEAQVIDFAKLLERSLSARKRGGAAAANDEDDEAAPPRRPKSAAQRKTAAAKGRRKSPSPRATPGHRRAA